MKRIFLIALFFMPLLAFCELVMHDFENTTEMDLEIEVPWYPNATGDYKAVTLTLKPGDVYKAKKGGNGHLLYNYGKAPDFFQTGLSVLKLEDPNEEEFDVKSYLYFEMTNIVNCQTMPEFWVKYSTNFYWSFKEGEKYKKKGYIGTPYMSITNLSEKALALVSEPKADPDGDGISNMNEFQCGSSPIVKDSFVLYPRIIGLEATGDVTTGLFSIINCMSTDAVCKIDVSDHELSFLGKQHPKDGPDEDYLWGVTKVFVKAKSARQLAVLMKTGDLPVQYGLSRHSFSDLITDFRRTYSYIFPCPSFYLKKRRVLDKVKSDVPLAPANGEVFYNPMDIVFKWKQLDDTKLSYVYIYRVDEKGFVKELMTDDSHFKTDYDYSSNFTSCSMKLKERAAKREKSFLSPGLYVWRIKSDTKYATVSASDWHWYCVPAAVSTNMPKRELYYGGVTKIPLDTFYYSYKISSLDYPDYADLDLCDRDESRLLSPPPEGLEYRRILRPTAFYSNDSFRALSNIVLCGTVKRAGLYTNTLEYVRFGMANSTYKIVKWPKYFFVSSPNRTTLNCSNGNVRHDLYAKSGYSFQISSAYCPAFTNCSTSLTKMKSASFENNLPKGLLLARLSNGLYITGMPQISYCTTNTLLIVGDAVTNRQAHVFNVMPYIYESYLPFPAMEKVDAKTNLNIDKIKEMAREISKKRFNGRVVEIKKDLER